MKPGKIIFAGLLLLLTLPAHAALQVFTCEPEWAALSKAIGGDKVKVYSATTAFQDVHHIQARPSLIAKIRKADILVCTGAELESGWLPVLLRRAANQKIQPGKPGHLMAAMQVERLEVPTRVDRSMGDIHAAGNPHVHLDPYRVAIIAEVLTQRLVQIDADNASFYQQQAQQFLQQWRNAIARWEQRAAPLSGTSVVVHHKDWRYLIDWLDMKSVAALEPKPGLPPTTGHLAELKRQMARQAADIILRAAYQDARPSEWLSEKTGIPAVELPFTVGGSDAAKDLFGLFDDTLARLLNVINS